MEDPDELYGAVHSDIVAIEEELLALEDGVGDSPSKRDEIALRVNRAQRDIDSLEGLLMDRGIMDDRWRRRISGLHEASSTARESLSRFLSTTYSVASVRRERAALFSGASAARVDAGTVDLLSKEHDSLRRSHRMADEFTDWSGAIMGSLEGQRGRIKGTWTRFLDLTASLGMSSSLVTVIQRRVGGDRAILAGGCVLIVCVLAVLYWYTRS